MSVNLATAPEGATRGQYLAWLIDQYWPESLPASGIVSACPLCGGMVLHRDVHAQWHADLAGLDAQ